MTDVWAVGNDGLIVAYQPSHDHPSFSHVESPKRVDWQDVDFVTPDDGWIVGGGDMILHWNGETWEISKPSTIDPWAQFYTYSFYNIAFSEANDGWAAGCVNSEGGGQILIYHWDGVGWSEKASLESANIIYARKPDDIFAIGDKLWHWDGSAWTEIDLTTDIYPVDPNIIDFIDVPGGRSSELWLLDSSGIIYTVNLYWLDFGN